MRVVARAVAAWASWRVIVCAAAQFPAKMDTELRFKNSRIRTMLEKCCDNNQLKSDDNKENQPPSKTSTGVSTSKNDSSNDNKITKEMTAEKLINWLNTQEYSLTAPVFRAFDETKNSLDLGVDLSHLVTTIKINSHQTNKEMLICYEDMLPISPCSSPSNDSPALDFSSDDSVRDKDYCPSEDTSSDDNGNVQPAKRSRLHDTVVSQDIRSSPSKEVGILDPQQQTISIQSEDNTGIVFSCNIEPQVVSSIQPALIEPSVSNVETSRLLETCQETCSIHPETGLSSLNNSSRVANNIANKTSISLRERKLQKKQEKLINYSVKDGCNEKCLKKCCLNFTTEARQEINSGYWALSWKERRVFIQNSTSVAIPKRKVTSEARRAPRSTFHLKNVHGNDVEVCKVFFLTTLGFHHKNDTVLYNSLKKRSVDRRGLHTKTAPFDRNLLTSHVESFQPLEPHYRREHAPLRRYLSCDITVTLMHKDFCEKYPEHKVSYELYRKHVKNMNISFAKLGNEECEVCEAYELHAKTFNHDAINRDVNCEACSIYVAHKEKYKKARQLYETHRNNKQSLENIYYSVDLQKVVMLPRIDSFKSIIFCPRLTAFNQSFAPVGKITTQHKPLACIWHDGVSGRKQEDVMSCYYYFILQYRDVKNITIWMDNCSAQNKNWLLFSLMIYLINSDLIATETISFHYFEPGHTFMSCDQFHHQVELGMKKKGKLYDFQDFVECVASANNSKVDVKTMEPQDFLSLLNLVSDRRIQTSTPRVYLKDIIQVRFQRKNFDVLYKNDLNEENFKVLRMMTDRYLKNTDCLKPEFKSVAKGIDESRKVGIINALKDICAPHKMKFWHDMPVHTERGTRPVAANRFTL